MTVATAVGMLVGLLKVAALLAAPVLLVSLVVGAFVGVVQSATQINEASVSFVLKLLAVVGVLVILGPSMGAQAVTYARENFRAIESVVH